MEFSIALVIAFAAFMHHTNAAIACVKGTASCQPQHVKATPVALVPDSTEKWSWIPGHATFPV
jgi:hypothetical protein